MQPTPCRRTKHPLRLSILALAALAFAAGPALARLERGDSGDEVRKVQEILKTKGIYTGDADGKYGASTEAAVKKFQQQNGLGADGVVGQKTLDKLFPVAAPKDPKLRSGSTDTEAVKRLQNLLNAKGASVKVDGKFGKGTVDAVKAFQKKNQLTPVDGVAGPKTWEKLKA